MQERLQQILNKVLEWWKKFNTKQRALMISITAVVIVALLILGVVVSKPTMVPLIQCEDAKQGAEVKEVLDGDSSINYTISQDGTYFEVDAKDEATAAMLLGQNDIPAQRYSIENVVNGGLSTTEADKQKKYKVYLEEKFASDLALLDFVKSASVVINLPEDDGTILSSQEEGTVAVTLDLRREIDEEQAYAIARMVATQLGNKTTDGITVIDTSARVLYSGADAQSPTGLASSQLTYKQKQENMMKAEVKSALLDSKIFSDIEVAMNLDMDFKKKETATKKYSYPEGMTQSLVDSERIYESEAENGAAAVPGTDANDDDVNYVTQDNESSSSSVSDVQRQYLNDEEITTETSSGGSINYDTSSVTVVATRYRVYNQKLMEEADELQDTTWEAFKVANADPVKVEDVNEDWVAMIANATGFSRDNISFVIYEQAEFVDKSSSARSLSDILQILLAVLIFALLGFVVFRSTRVAEEEELEPELSVEKLLESTAEANDPLSDIGYSEKSEARMLIEKFVDENPDAVALLLRNWLNEDWE